MLRTQKQSLAAATSWSAHLKQQHGGCASDSRSKSNAMGQFLLPEHGLCGVRSDSGIPPKLARRAGISLTHP